MTETPDVKVARAAKAVWARVRSASLVKWAVGIGVVLALIELVPRWQPPVYPFKTYGKIYVDSPEVYTRERLVNDRYDQDHWLRTKLKELDDATNFISEQTRFRFDGRLTEAGGPDTPTVDASLPDAPQDLTYGQLIEVQNSIRSSLRQRILENLLDDRHDLSGNSLYGFKFDTTVLAGTNTSNSAFVRLSMTSNSFNEIRMPEAEDGTPERQATTADFVYASMYPDHPLRDQYVAYDRLYQDWLENLQGRLNHYVAQEEFGRSKRCGPRLIERRILKVLDDVLSINSTEVTITQIPLARAPQAANASFSVDEPPEQQAFHYQLTIEKPWGALIRLGVQPGKGNECVRDLSFTVGRVWEVFYLFKTGPEFGWGVPPEAMQRGYVRTFNSQDARIVATSLNLGTGRINLKLDADYPRRLTDYVTLIDESEGSEEPFGQRQCLQPVPEPGSTTMPQFVSNCDPDESFYPLVLETGVLNLIDRLSKQDSYSYAILPDSDATGVAHDSSQSIGAGAALGGALGSFAVGQGARGTSVKGTITGFSDSSVAHTGQVDFGWVINTQRGQTSFQSDQMALISVPASTNEIYIKISRGWLDRFGEVQIEEEPYNVTVALPPDFEAFETIIFDRSDSVRRQPIIFDKPVGEEEGSGVETVFVCRENRVMIPGRRLWRSTEVTLGGYQADRIVVMPNMQGIIAIFDRLPAHLATDVPNEEGEIGPRPLPLRVWTSEGFDKDKRTFIPALGEATMTPDGRCPT